MASARYGTLYIGVTNNLIHRVNEHRSGSMGSFTHKYHCRDLVFFEETDSVHVAIEREKQLKNWKRSWKIELIEKENSGWEDLSKTIM